MTKRSPDAIYIGYQKTGSTFLRAYFEAHPQIHWTRNAHVFRRPFGSPAYQQYIENYLNDPICYVDSFEGLATGVMLVSEKFTVKQRFDPSFPLDLEIADISIDQIAENIHRINPRAKIIISLREQVSWLVSNWSHFINHLPPDRNSFLDFLKTFEGKTLLYSGQFHLTLEAFQQRFGPKNVHVTLLEHLYADETGTLEELCSFLGVDNFQIRLGEEDKNQGKDAIDLLLSRSGGAKLSRIAAVRWFYNFSRPLRKKLARKAKPLLVSKEVQATLRAFYAPSNALTSRLIGMDLNQYGYGI